MNYHDIRTDDMVNGTGLRVVLFVAGCSHCCEDCHNPETWDSKSGKIFGINERTKIICELSKDYINGVTLSGGDPLYESNLFEVLDFIKFVREYYPEKTIWIYTGYTWEKIFYTKMPSPSTNEKDRKDFLNWNLRNDIVSKCDVMVDGEFDKELADVNYHWAGSTNQRVIDVKASLENRKVILWENN